jgi:hypothetical protein
MASSDSDKINYPKLGSFPPFEIHMCSLGSNYYISFSQVKETSNEVNFVPNCLCKHSHTTTCHALYIVYNHTV